MSRPELELDLSMFGLFLRADVVVQIIMIGLVLASLLCWSIIFGKLGMLKKTRKATQAFEKIFWSGISLDEILKTPEAQSNSPMSIMFVSAMRGYEQSHTNSDILQIRIERIMNVTLQKESYKLDSQMSVLASIGSSAPFVGLLGTVWGIMNSFTAIAATKQTSLAIVAPGIAEALFATALGLFAAIPATIAYNKLSSDIDLTYGNLESFKDEFIAMISR